MYQQSPSGGGFMRGGGVGGFNTTPGGGYGGGGAGGEQKRCCLPVSIKQILTADEEGDSDFVIDGKRITQVTFVAQIRSITETSTNVKYKVEDGTGAIEIMLWLDQNETEDMRRKRGTWLEGTYIRVVGSIRTFLQKRSIAAQNISLVTDYDEITFGLLEALYTHLKSTARPTEQRFNPHIAPANANAYGMPQPNAAGGASAYGGMAGAPVGGGASAGYGAGDLMLSAPQRDALNIIRGTSNGEGMSVNEIIQQLRKYGEYEIRQAIEFLSSEGHIYSTIDDDHYLSTDS